MYYHNIYKLAFNSEFGKMNIAVFNKIVERSPLKHILVRGLLSLDLAHPNSFSHFRRCFGAPQQFKVEKVTRM